MYGEDPRDFGMGPQWVDEEIRDARSKMDEEDAYDTNRPRVATYDETLNGE